LDIALFAYYTHSSTFSCLAVIITDAQMQLRFEVKFYPGDPSSLVNDIAR